MGYTVLDVFDFERKVRQNYRGTHIKWLPVFLANANSDSHVVDFILQNFEAMDVISNDVDFYLPGYYNDSYRSKTLTIELLPNDDEQVMKIDEFYSRANDILNDFRWRLLSDRAEFDVSKSINCLEQLNHLKAELDSLSAIIQQHSVIVGEKKSTLASLEEFTKNDYPEYKGNPIRVFKSRRLGDVFFNDAQFADFVLELSVKNKKYHYSGACELLLLPVKDGIPQYDLIWVVYLNKIAERSGFSSGISLESFIFHVFNIIRDDMYGDFSNSKSFSSIGSVGRDNFMKYVLDPNYFCCSHADKIVELESDVSKYNELISRRELKRQHKSFFDLLFSRQQETIRQQDEFKRELEDFCCSHKPYFRVPQEIAKLYREATMEMPKQDRLSVIETVSRMIRDHLHWSLDMEFYFISYSSKDVMKAMHLKHILENNNRHVWIAPDGIPVGEDYSLIIPNVLYKARHFVLLLTDYSAESKWVRREIELAINYDNRTTIEIVFADGYNMEKLSKNFQMDFLLRIIQAKYSYEEIVNDKYTLSAFLNN